MKTINEEKELRLLNFKLDAKLSAINNAMHSQNVIVGATVGKKGEKHNVIAEAEKIYQWLMKGVKDIK
jgi:hypothetical protein